MPKAVTLLGGTPCRAGVAGHGAGAAGHFPGSVSGLARPDAAAEAAHAASLWSMDRSRESRGPETAGRWAGRAAESTAAGSPSSACGRAAVRCCTDPRCPAEVAWLCRCWCRRDDPVQREKE